MYYKLELSLIENELINLKHIVLLRLVYKLSYEILNIFYERFLTYLNMNFFIVFLLFKEFLIIDYLLKN